MSERRVPGPYDRPPVQAGRRNVSPELIAAKHDGTQKVHKRKIAGSRLTMGKAVTWAGGLIAGIYVASGFLAGTPTENETGVRPAAAVSANGERLGGGENACIPPAVFRMIVEPKGYHQSDSSQLKDFSGAGAVAALSEFANTSSVLNFQAAVEQIETSTSMTDSSQRRLRYLGEKAPGSLEDYIRSCFDPVIAHYRNMSGGQTIAGVMVSEEQSVLRWTKEYIEEHPRVNLHRQNDVKQMVLNYLANVAYQKPELADEVAKIREAYLSSRAWEQTELPK